MKFSEQLLKWAVETDDAALSRWYFKLATLAEREEGGYFK